MTRLRQLAVAAICLALFGGCGYFQAGVWEDDPASWSRAFGSDKPPDVVVLHSHYERSPHWTYEFAYYFQLEPNAALKAQLLTENDLRVADGEALERSRPAWFTPGDRERYEVYRYANDPFSQFRLFVDLESDDLFLSDAQF